MTLQIAIVILNWNGRKYLHDFLPFVIKYKPGSAKIFVADNLSSDDSIALLKKDFPNVEIIELKENFGFAKGYNEALKQINAEYYVILNSDIEVTENWIEPQIDYLEINPKVAACQPKIKSYFNREQFEYAGAGGGFIDYLGYPFCRGRIFQEIETDQGQFNDIQEVFWASGACLFVKSEIFHELGGFDEDFFAHMEEIDFCWHAKNNGYKIVYNPESTVYHIGGGTLPKNNSFKTYLNFRNNLCLLYKNLPDEQLFKTFFFRMILDGIAAFKFLLDGSYRDLAAVFRAHVYFYKNISKLDRKRKAINQKQVSGIYKNSLVFDHFIRGKKLFKDLYLNKFSK